MSVVILRHYNKMLHKYAIHYFKPTDFFNLILMFKCQHAKEKQEKQRYKTLTSSTGVKCYTVCREYENVFYVCYVMLCLRLCSC